MARISLVDGDTVEQWQDHEIEQFYRNSYWLQTPPPTSLAMESHHPEFMRAWCRFWWSVFHGGAVDHALKDLVRIRLAETSSCDYCADLRSGAAPQMGAGPSLSVVDGTDAAALAPGANAIVHFVEVLAVDSTAITAEDIARLSENFSREQLAELMAFSAWQYGGPRMIHTWNSEDYRVRDDGSRIALTELPVRLAYNDAADDVARVTYVPELDSRSYDRLVPMVGSAESALHRWLDLLSNNDRALWSWSDLYVTIMESGVLSSRLKHLIRVRLAQLLDYEPWAPRDDKRLAELGIGEAERQALRSSKRNTFSDQERAALDYAEMLSFGSDMPDDVFLPLAEVSTEQELVEVGFTVAVQTGTIRVCQAFDNTLGWPRSGSTEGHARSAGADPYRDAR